MVSKIFEELEMDTETAILKEEGEYIYNFLKEKNIKRTLEIGFAYGCSSAYIILATQSKHYAIDPYQPWYQSLGKKNIERLKLSQYLDLKEEVSQFALPKMIKEGVKIDFAFIDGGHLFDEIFVDFYFVDMMLEENGYILFHDIWMPSTKAVLSWIANNKKNYEIIELFIGDLIMVRKLKNEQRVWDHFESFDTSK
jgi:predicted O-methyltransferase YrrM